MRIASVGGAGSAAAAGRAAAGTGDAPLAPAAGGGVSRGAQASAAQARSARPARADRRFGDVIGATPPHPVGRGKPYPGTLSEIGCQVFGTAGGRPLALASRLRGRQDLEEGNAGREEVLAAFKRHEAPERGCHGFGLSPL